MRDTRIDDVGGVLPPPPHAASARDKPNTGLTSFAARREKSDPPHNVVKSAAIRLPRRLRLGERLLIVAAVPETKDGLLP